LIILINLEKSASYEAPGFYILILFCDSTFSGHFCLLNGIFAQHWPWVALSIK
jgi:hypothetical protein